jgi:Cu(I)/Ag(I) efflux system membrane fusion protein
MVEKEKKAGGVKVMGIVAALLLIAFLVGYMAGGGRRAAAPPSKEAHREDAVSRQVEEAAATWTCSMHPQIRLPEPGQCPICFMDLIPVKENAPTGAIEAVSLRQMTFSPEARKLAEVVVQPVERGSVSVETRMVGKVDYDETRLGHITAWMGGRIDKLYVDYTGSVVKKGQPMAEIYSPELLTAQAELIQASKAIRELEKSGLQRVKDSAKQTERAAREKLRLLGLPEGQIKAVLERGTPSDHITLHATMSGVVIQKDILEGMYVKTGERIYTIADLSRVWVVLEAYESDLPWVKLRQDVEFQTDAYPGEIFKGKVVYIDPIVNEKTRTVKVRLDVPNPKGKLKPGMFVRASKQSAVKGDQGSLVIPASAPLITGKRAIVYVQIPGKEGTYEGKEIVLGPRAGDHYIVRSGLVEGELVVTKGNFKIDSAVQLQAKPSMMNPQGEKTRHRHAHDDGTFSSGPRAQMGQSSFQLPAHLASKLPQLITAYEETKRSLETQDLEKIRQANKAFYDALDGIDPGSLKGPAALAWKEHTMLLRNDTFLGSEADTREEAARLFVTLTEHFGHFRADFVRAAPAPLPLPMANVSSDFRKQLDLVLDSYLELQASLAADDVRAATDAGARVNRALQKLDISLLQEDAHRVWLEAFEKIKAGLGLILKAEDIEGIRRGFEPLSVGLAEAIDHLGVDRDKSLFELYCPMAFNDTGALWLQEDQDIRNPYFGAAMLQCGEVQRQLRGNEK